MANPYTPLGVGVQFHPHSTCTLRHMLVHPKGPIPEEKRKGVVYSIPCQDCDKKYIGQTGLNLVQRLGEHRRALKNGDVTMHVCINRALSGYGSQS